jgi:hypothetical protein
MRVAYVSPGRFFYKPVKNGENVLRMRIKELGIRVHVRELHSPDLDALLGLYVHLH